MSSNQAHSRRFLAARLSTVKRSFVTPMDGFSQASFLATPESCCLDSTNLCYSVYYYHRSATTCPAA